MHNNEPMTKERLQDHVKMLQEIENLCDRLEVIIEKNTSPASAKLDGMPKGSSYRDHMAASIAKKDALEQEIKRAIHKEQQEAEDIEEAVRKLKKPDERHVIRLRYIDQLEWPEICEILYGRDQEFEDRTDSYTRKMFRIHGSALANLEAATTPPEDERSEEAKSLPKV